MGLGRGGKHFRHSSRTTQISQANTINWSCPECGAMHPAFLCECDAQMSTDHGRTAMDPCKNAHCYECNFVGTYPPEKSP